MENVFNYVYVFKTSKNGKGIIRADDITEVTEKIRDFSGDEAVFVKRATEIENIDYGYIMYENMWQ